MGLYPPLTQTIDTEIGEIEYIILKGTNLFSDETENGRCHPVQVNNHPGESLDVVIFPDKINGYPFSVIDRNAFKGFQCKELFLPNCINTLGYHAFEDANISIIHLPPSLQQISEGCFINCSVEKIVFDGENNISEISKMAFMGTKNLKSFDWPSKCDTIPMGCFSGSGVSSINNLENVREIFPDAFSSTPNLKNLNWPTMCKTIPINCFYNSGIENLHGLNHVSKIRAQAFRGAALKSIILGNEYESLTIDMSAFGKKIEHIDVPECPFIYIERDEKNYTEDILCKRLLSVISPQSDFTWREKLRMNFDTIILTN